MPTETPTKKTQTNKAQNAAGDATEIVFVLLWIFR